MKKKNISHLDFSSSEAYSDIAADYFRVMAGIGKERRIIEDEELLDHFEVIVKIHDFVTYITSVEFEIRSSQYLGKQNSTDLTQNRLAKYFDKFSEMFDELEFKRPFRYSEQVELFWDQVGQFLRSNGHRLNIYLIDSYNEIIVRIMEAAKGVDYRKRLESRRKSVVNNCQSVSTHISSLFREYPQLHIVRIDLLTSRFPDPQLTGIDDAHALLKIFLKDSHRKALFRNVAGYIWKLEYSKLKGSYFHFVLLLEKSDLLLTDFIADRFGKFWVESVTNSQGSYLICKPGVALRRSSAIGVVKGNEVDALRSLSDDLQYLMLKDFYLFPSIFVRDGKRQKRTYGHSEV
jgi:uncharacterized FlaG/YvyC family protein